MSELTPCNYCSLVDIIRCHQGQTVELRYPRVGAQGQDGWTACYVDGERVAMFLELPTECVC